MDEKKYEHLGKPLKMVQLFRGFAPSLIDPIQITEFKWTESVYDLCHGQVAWIRPRLDDWLTELNEKSGVQVKSYSFVGDKFERHCFGKRSWKLVLEFVIPGALKHRQIDSSLSKDFSGFIKKFLAEEVMRRFPLRLTADGKRNIPFKAGYRELIVLSPTRHYIEEIEEMQLIVMSEAFMAKLNSRLQSKFDAQAVYLRHFGQDLRFWESNVLIVKWDSDASLDQRYKLACEIAEVLKELGATYSYDDSIYDMYKVQTMA